MVAELISEAEARGVSLPQHVADLLRARYVVRHGGDYAALLWVPAGELGAQAQAQPADQAAEDQPPAQAAAAASAWLNIDDD